MVARLSACGERVGVATKGQHKGTALHLHCGGHCAKVHGVKST